MKPSFYLLILLPFALVGCAGEPTVTTTTTTQEVTTTGPAREVVVTRPPPPVRLETETVAPGPDTFGQPVIGDGPEPITSGYLERG